MLKRVAISLGIWLWVCPALAVSGSPGVWIDVPFVRQQPEGCGAASIAMIMQYWQQQSHAIETRNAELIQQALYSNKAHGIYAADVERYFREHGFQTFAFRGEWSDLQQHLEKGRPLLVALKSGSGEALHYVVVTGLDSEQGPVLVNDPARRKLLKQDKAEFVRSWSAAGNWTLLALPRPEAK